MQSHQKPSRFVHFFLLPFYFFLVSGSVQAQTAEERKIEEDRVLKSCRDNLNAQKFQEGLLACQAALEDFKKTYNLRGQGLALNNIGVNYNALDQYQKAIDNLQQSLKISREIKDQRLEVRSLGNLGLAYSNLGKYDKAIEFQLQSLAIATQQNLKSINLLQSHVLVEYHAPDSIQAMQIRLVLKPIKDKLNKAIAQNNIELESLREILASQHQVQPTEGTSYIEANLALIGLWW
jgi:tetratricopeptide (TPR) repeat protein